MNDFDVMNFRNFRAEKKIAACETLSGDRFQLKQITLRGCEVSVVFSDGTKSKPEFLQRIEVFETAKDLQKFLLRV